MAILWCPKARGAVFLAATLFAGMARAHDPSPVSTTDASETPESWFRDGAEQAAANAARGARPRARNVIVFLGDGMSIPTITAARILDGQRKGDSGENNRLSFEKFPYTALSKTYETDMQTPDSAGTMTAIMTGVKTRGGEIGVDQRSDPGNCASSRGHELVNALELASVAGMATGVVTTTRITHATPAAAFAHSPERGWEFDIDLSDEARREGCVDLARQLVEFPLGHGIDVALGGGRTGFMPSNQRDPEYPQLAGKRADGKDLVAAWLASPGSVYVWNARQLAALDLARTRRLLGLFEPEHLHYEHERATDAAGEPSLSELTRAALSVLARNPRGYFLMVEGGRIDHAHHAGNAFRALTETIEFAHAVQTAADMTSASDTLIIVTADHSHTLTFVGYPARGNPILGKVHNTSGEGAPVTSKELERDATGRSYATLGYANGPGYAGASDRQPEGAKHYPHDAKTMSIAQAGRPNLDDVDTEAPDYEQEAGIPMKSETHGGDDVAVFARGPGAEAIHGSLEQNALFHFYVQATPSLRAVLCRIGACDAHGVPNVRPDRARLLELDAKMRRKRGA